MSDRVVTSDLLPETIGVKDGYHSKWFLRILPIILFLLGLCVVAVTFKDFVFSDGAGGFASTSFSVVLGIFLSVLPAMICVVQITTRKRQLIRLRALGMFPVGQTMHFRVALTSVDNAQTDSVDADFGPPLFVYFFIILVGVSASLLGYSYSDALKVPNFILSGLHRINEKDFVDYQIGTLCTAATAFFAAYVYSLGRLLDRVNNNDLYPISLYYYAVRVVVACITAALMRHTADIFGLQSTSALLLIAFAIGFTPDLFIRSFTRRAFQMIKIWGNRDEPGASTRPLTLPLLMIDDLSREKIDRFSEIGIDSAHVLAKQNPFLLLTRIPYDLGLIMDWIAQAQLYVLVKDETLGALRGAFIRDICDLHIALQADPVRPDIHEALGLDAAGAISLLRQLDQDPSFVRLKEVRDAMRLLRVGRSQPAAG